MCSIQMVGQSMDKKTISIFSTFLPSSLNTFFLNSSIIHDVPGNQPAKIN